MELFLHPLLWFALLYNLIDQIINNIEGIDPEFVFVEPSGKNTAPAIGMMGAYFALDNPDGIMGIFPADHLIVGHRKFEKVITREKFRKFRDFPKSPSKNEREIVFEK